MIRALLSDQVQIVRSRQHGILLYGVHNVAYGLKHMHTGLKSFGLPDPFLKPAGPLAFVTGNQPGPAAVIDIR